MLKRDAPDLAQQTDSRFSYDEYAPFSSPAVMPGGRW